MSSRMAGRFLRQSSHGKKRYHGSKPAPPALSAVALGYARQRQIADRDHVRFIGGPGMAAAVAERVKLLDVADPQAGLLLDPGAQADLEGAVRQRVERTEGKSRAQIRFVVARNEDCGLTGLNADDRGGQPDFDRREGSFRHRYSRSSRNGSVA